jgi:Tn3 transposase DDE domain
VARVLDDDDLIEHWTLVGDELDPMAGRTGPSKLGLALWLADHVCSRERQPQRVREALLGRLRGDRIEQPAKVRLGRIIGSALRKSEEAGPVILTDLDAVPEPRNLRRLKSAVRDRWGTVPLLDMLTETALRTGCLDAFTPAGTRSGVCDAALFQRLLLTVYAYGTNTGIRAVAAGERRAGKYTGNDSRKSTEEHYS